MMKKVLRMVRRASHEVGCRWCRGCDEVLSPHIIRCERYNRQMLLKNDNSCPKFQRGLEAEEVFQVLLFNGCTAEFLGADLNKTEILPHDMISQDQFFDLLRIAARSHDLSVRISRSPYDIERCR
jgi:hypothetical protein